MSKGRDSFLFIQHPPPHPPSRMRKTSSSKSASVGASGGRDKPNPPAGGDRTQTSERINASTHRPSHSNSNLVKNTSTATASVIDRDSKASIRDDPFFRPYQAAQSARMAEKVRNESARSPADVGLPNFPATHSVPLST